jgi:hypothetical protein
LQPAAAREDSRPRGRSYPTIDRTVLAYSEGAPESAARLLDALAERLLPSAPEAIARLTRLLLVTSLILLLALGSILSSTLAWALIAMPMTLIVASLLAEWIELRAARADELEVPDVEPTVVARRVAAPQSPAASAQRR